MENIRHGEGKPQMEEGKKQNCTSGGRQTEMGTRIKGARGGRERAVVKRKVSQAVGN